MHGRHDHGVPRSVAAEAAAFGLSREVAARRVGMLVEEQLPDTAAARRALVAHQYRLGARSQVLLVRRFGGKVHRLAAKLKAEAARLAKVAESGDDAAVSRAVGGQVPAVSEIERAHAGV